MNAFFSKYKYHLAIFLIVSVIFLTNYQPSTFLTGWDSLQSELNPWLSVKRSFFAVWQEYQSFGLVSGMAHASDLVRAFFVWLISAVLPKNLVRYFYHHLMLLLGALGMLKLLSLSFLTPEVKEPRFNRDGKTSGVKNGQLFAFLGALFYILNLGTVQIFFVPFEAFSTFFAFLPWGIWSFLKFAKTAAVDKEAAKVKKRRLVLLLLINLLGTPAFYVQTLFVVYIILLALITLGLLWQEKSLVLVKKTFLAFILIFLVNSFWILPQLYFLKTTGDVVREAKINQLATEDIFYQNKEKGTLGNFLKMEGFYFDLFDSKRKLLFLAWQEHFSQPIFKSIRYLFILIVILGFFYKTKYRWLFILSFLFVALFLLGNTAGFSQINDFLRKIDFIEQIFRSSFTKFIIPYSLFTSYFFAAGIAKLSQIGNLTLYHLGRDRSLDGKFLILSILFFVLLILYALPAFSGFYFSPEMKVKIPDEYFELMDYFNKQDQDKRIALLPDYTFWGWFFHRWGYNGSGFLWYGVEQPIVSRTFDVWSDKSEGYFWQVKKAIEAEDTELFEKVLEKYNIDYLLVDYSLLPVVATLKGMQYERTDSIIKQSGRIELVKKWPDIALYKVNQPKSVKNFTSVVQTLPNIGPAVKVTNEDSAYFSFGDYQTSEKEDFDLYFPFLDLITQTRLPDKRWIISEDFGQFKIKTKLDMESQQYDLIGATGKLQALLYKSEKLATYSALLSTEIEGKTLKISFPKDKIHDFVAKDTRIDKCFFKGDDKDIIIKGEYRSLIVGATDKATLCFGYDAPFLEQKYGYLLKIQNKNIDGRRLFFYALDQTKKQAYIEDRLGQDTQYYIIPPKFRYGVGYAFVFHHNSYQKIPAENKLETLDIYLFPYQEIKNIYLKGKEANEQAVPFFGNFKTNKINYFTYKVDLFESGLRPDQEKTVILHQSFHPGWRAYLVERETWNVKRFLNTYFPFLLGKKLKEHVLVNNWANAWRLPAPNPADQTSLKPCTDSTCEANVKLGRQWQSNNGTIQPFSHSAIIVIFWPQYLEFLGLAFLIITFLGIVKMKN